MRDDPELLINEFFERLDELESLAHEITGRLQARRPRRRRRAPLREKPFELVVVCTGNRVRSPVAEGFLRMLSRACRCGCRPRGCSISARCPRCPETL